jgi:predicted MPP superfamily phosphohydrolase
MGLYEENGMIAYTNRGVGMEGGAAPRVRFLSPPELALFTITGK